MKKERREQLLNTDFDTARDGIKDLINTGMDAVDGIMRVATAGDSPRAYEVAATLLKTISDMNKDLLEIHKQANDAEKDKVSVRNTTNNSIHVGSTTDLQNLLNKSRSQFKSDEQDETIINLFILTQLPLRRRLYFKLILSKNSNLLILLSSATILSMVNPTVSISLDVGITVST